MNILKSLLLSLAVMALVMACNDEGATGKIQISITDAPLYEDDIVGVHIKVTGVEIKSDNGWENLEAFEEPVTINLLDYQNGEVYFLTEEEISAGSYKEIRLILDIVENGDSRSNVGTFLEFEDGSTQPLFVPSGATSGYKAKGEFDVPVDGVTGLTIDFNVRKSVVKTGNSGDYILKPVLRLVENDQVALIKGELEAEGNENQVVVYAYEEGTFTLSETQDPADGIDFPEAISSAVVGEDGTFTLAFMEPGVYDLYAVAYDQNGEFVEVLVELSGVQLDAGEIQNVLLEVVEEGSNG